MGYEYKVVPAPKRGLKAKGMKTSEDRFANALQDVMNTLGADGWEYQRTDTLPCEEREGLMGKTTVFQNMLVFRRSLTAPAAPEIAAPDAPETPKIPTPDPRVAETLTATPPVTAEAHKLAAKPLDDETARPDPKVAAE